MHSPPPATGTLHGAVAAAKARGSAARWHRPDSKMPVLKIVTLIFASPWSKTLPTVPARLHRITPHSSSSSPGEPELRKLRPMRKMVPSETSV